MSFQLQDLVSPDYLATQQALHSDPRGYGEKGSRWADTVLWVARRYQCQSVLDYGCGRGSLKRAVEARGLQCSEYDPAVAGKDQMPARADLVVCTDVLEHVEIDRLPAVLKHLEVLAIKAVFLVVCLKPSGKLLPDGRNAHITLRPPAWWDAQAEQQHWELQDVPDLPMPGKVDPEKFWIAVARP